MVVFSEMRLPPAQSSKLMTFSTKSACIGRWEAVQVNKCARRVCPGHQAVGHKEEAMAEAAAVPSEPKSRFQRHVFISYAHLDNEPLQPGQMGWISRLHD